MHTDYIFSSPAQRDGVVALRPAYLLQSSDALPNKFLCERALSRCLTQLYACTALALNPVLQKNIRTYVNFKFSQPVAPVAHRYLVTL